MKYLGIDFGLKRVGLATSEGDLASPLKIIEVKGFKDAVKSIEELVNKEGFDKIIIGLPEGKIGRTVLDFVKAFKKKGADVECADETLSSQRAIQQMIKSGIPKRKRLISDDIAAAIILQNYLDNQ